MPLAKFSRRVLVPLLIAVIAGTCSDSQRPTGTVAPTAPSIPTPTPAPPTLTVTGTIFDAHTTRPIDGAAVRVTDGPNVGRTATSDAAGKYTLAGLSSGSIVIQFTAAGFITSTHTATLSGNSEVSILLRRPNRSISGTVTDATSRGVLPNILLTATSGTSQGASTRSDGRGQYTLSNVTADSFKLTATATSYAPLEVTAAAGGDTQLDLVLSRVPAPAPGTATSTFLSFNSDPGDPLRGASATYTVDDSNFQVFTGIGNLTGAESIFIVASRKSDPGDASFLDVVAPVGQRFKAATTYGGTTDTLHPPAVQFSSNSRGCTTFLPNVTRFTIDVISRDPSDRLSFIQGSFEQTCFEASGSLRGRFAAFINPLR